MAVLSLHIDNMHCGACIRRVTQTLNALPNTHANTVQLGQAQVTSTAPPDQLLQALTTAGYPARLA